ncbi:hypothetical protein NA56DRAFT_386502 [Hyaloscypha hepaticicola]|uniref:Uncharacterized protein n=1 Tax=Hyaloscypha hepaticicola TaxID=2082293 RepID=A0A2J6QHQ8_9HELO|nr:hypothetical protein NA56DRAFT_386502 [Hyaloscypha hepaticicola]
MKKVWLERWLTSPRMAIERQRPIQNTGIAIKSTARLASGVRRYLQFGVFTVYLQLFSTDKAVESRLQPLCSRDFPVAPSAYVPSTPHAVSRRDTTSSMCHSPRSLRPGAQQRQNKIRTKCWNVYVPYRVRHTVYVDVVHPTLDDGNQGLLRCFAPLRNRSHLGFRTLFWKSLWSSM